MVCEGYFTQVHETLVFLSLITLADFGFYYNFDLLSVFSFNFDLLLCFCSILICFCVFVQFGSASVFLFNFDLLPCFYSILICFCVLYNCDLFHRYICAMFAISK